MLEGVIEQFWSKETNLQQKPLTETIQRLVMRILEFTRLLLENCSSRNIYASYDRLKRLLVTDDMVILEATLELLLIPARKLDSQSSLRNTFEREIGSDELAILAQLSLPFIPEMGELEEAKFALCFREYHMHRLQGLISKNSVQMQYIKMISTAIFLMAQPEGAVDSAFFAMSPTLVADTARMISVTPEMPMKVELAALSILRSCLKMTSRWNEIIHTLNLTASHGAIASIFRSIVDCIVAEKDPPYTIMFIFAYFDFVSLLSIHVDMDDSFVNSGIVSEAVRAIEAIHPRYYKILEKMLYILDALVHHYATALDFFFSYNGLSGIVRQITGFIERASTALSSDSQKTPLAYTESTLLQCLLRFMDKLLITNGADDRLRTLLDGPLFKSFLVIFDHSSQFTVEIVSYSVSIVANFIHNEPTALTVLQEVGTPQALIRCIKTKIPSSAELLAKIPYAFSAVCLNSAGTESFSQIDPVETLCRTFLDPEMLKILRSRSTATSLGTAMDEFVRHHPQFRAMVIKDIVGVLNSLPKVLAGIFASKSRESFFGCELVRDAHLGDPAAPERRQEPILSQTLETLCSFIEGVVQTPSHAKEFMDAGGVNALMGVFFAPGVSFDFTVYNESLSISHMLRVLSDIDTQRVISDVLINLVKHAPLMDEFLSQMLPRSFFAESIMNPAADIEPANKIFQHLTSTLAVFGLLRDLYVTHSYTFIRVGGALLKGFTTTEGEAALILMSIILKVSSWEFGHLMFALDEPLGAGVLVRARSDFKAPVYTHFSSAFSQISVGRKISSLSEEYLRSVSLHPKDARVRNTLCILFTLQRLSSNILAIFGGLAKMLSAKSSTTDSEQGERLAEFVVNGAINAIGWLNTDSRVAPLELQSFFMSQVLQFLQVLLVDETGSRTGSLNSIVIPFYSSSGVKELTRSIENFMLAGLNSTVVLEDFVSAVRDIVNCFSTFTNHSIKKNFDTGALDSILEMIVQYCTQFLRLPVPFRRALGSEVSCKMLKCFSNLILSGKQQEDERSVGGRRKSGGSGSGSQTVSDLFVDFQTKVLANFRTISEEFLFFRETTLDVALLVRTLISYQDPGAASSHETDDEEKVVAENSARERSQEASDRAGILVGWIISHSCPLPTETRLWLLATIIDYQTRSLIYPLLFGSMKDLAGLIEGTYKDVQNKNENVSGDQEGKKRSEQILASGMLLCAEVIFFSTIPIEKPGHSGDAVLFSEQLESSVLKGLHEVSLGLLASPESSLDLDFSVLYLLAAISRVPASHGWLEAETLIPLLARKSQGCLETRDRRYRSMFALSTILLRHLVETPAYLKLIMESEMMSSNPPSFGSRSKVKNFLSAANNEFSIGREFNAFHDALYKNFILTWEDDRWTDPLECFIATKRSFWKSKRSEDLDQLVPQVCSLDDLQNFESSPQAQKIVGCLIDQLMLITEFPSSESAEENEKAEGEGKILSAHFQRCTLIIMLVELIHCYPVCRRAFLETPKLSTFLAFLFDKMTPSGELAGTLGSRVFVNESMWVSQLLDDLCVGPAQVSANEKLSLLPEQVKLVVDSLALALKRFLSEVGLSINTYSLMSRAWCLTMTVYVLISVKSNSASRIIGPVQSAITARMLEKSYISLLSSILKNIDSKAPMAPMVAAKIVFALEILTRLGNRVSRIATGANEINVGGSNSEGFDDDFDSEEDGDDVEVDSEDQDGSDDDDDDDDDQDSEREDDMMDLDSQSDNAGSSESGDEDEDDEDVDDDDGMELDDEYTVDEEDYSSDGRGYYDGGDDDDHYHVVVRPPIGRSGPARDAAASGFQVIPAIEDGMTREGIRNSLRVGSFDVVVDDFEQGNRQGGENGNDENEQDYMSEEDLEEDEGFSVDGDEEDEEEEDDFNQVEQVFFDDGQLMSFRPRAGTFARRTFPGRLFGEFGDNRHTYSSQVREADVYAHPLLARSDAAARMYGFETQRMSSSGAPLAESKTWQENQDVFHSPQIATTIKRWTQENKLFLTDSAGKISPEVARIIIRGLAQDARKLCDQQRQQEKEGSGEDRIDQSETDEEVQRSGRVGGREQSQGETQDESSRGENPILGTTTTLLSLDDYSSVQEQEQQQATFYEDAGPDREFLEALPFEMRREVLEQYFEERRRNIPDGAVVTVSQSFLNSLPNDLREDFVRMNQQEIDRNRRRGGRAGSNRLMGDLDLGTLLEDLAPAYAGAFSDVPLDMEVFSRDSSGQRGRRPNPEQLSELIGAMSESMRRLRESYSRAPNENAASSSGSQAAVSIAKRDYLSMVDISSLATILRIYYDPLMTEHRTHMRLFQHLCVGQSTLTDLLNMLIYILEEMPDDLVELDAVLDNYVTLKHAKSSKSKTATPKATPKKKSPVSKSVMGNDPFGGSAYVVIQQRTLQVLMQLVQHNDEVRRFFTSSCESHWTIKRIDRKAEKGASAKTSVVMTKYPIVLLLACLERQSFVQIPLLVENLLHLLQLVTVPLKNISSKMQDSKEQEEALKNETPDIPSSFISAVVRAIIQCELSPKAFQYSTQAFQNLSLIGSAAETILSELSEISQRLAESTGRDARLLLEAIRSGQKSEVNKMLKNMSQPASHQLKLLRCMKVLSSTILRPLKPEEDRGNVFDCLIESSGVNWSRAIENAKSECWARLFQVVDHCLVAIRDEIDMYHVAAGLLPAIEAHFWHVRQAVALIPECRAKEEENVFSFAERNRVVLNTMIRASTSLLTNGAFILLTKMPRVLDFDNKRAWFRQQLHKKGIARPTLTIHVRRAHIFEDSFHAIMGRSGEEVKYGRLSIKFHEEEGLDAGGITREWFAVLSRQMFDPNYALFKVSTVDKITYQPNRTSYINPDHLQYFTFVGRIIGKAIYDSRLLDCYFTRSFYKHILRLLVDFKDLEAVDPEFYKSLVWILENDITDVVELSFSVEADEFGIHKIIDLKPDGQSIMVTEDNKREYVKLVTEYKLTTAIKPQIDAFLRGFNEVVPAPLINIFNEQELELLISGMPDIDVDDWKNNTEYSGYSVSSPQIQWFWRAVRSFDQEYRAKLLQFVTGTSKVPLDGFSSLQGSNGVQKFQIHRDYGAKDRLPSAHTCFNQLDLPEYESHEILRVMLVKAIHECSAGFGLV